MPIEEYVSGNKNKSTFCYMIEETFECFGVISGRTSAYTKYVIYWNKHDQKYKFGDKRTKRRQYFGSTEEEIFSNVKKEIKNIIIAARNNDYKTIAESHLNPQFKNKIAYLYNSDCQIPIYSDDDLSVILSILEIPFNPNEDRAFNREKLYKFYVENELNKRLSTYMFMSFIYNWMGYRAYLRRKEKIDFDIAEYKIVDVDVDTIINSERSNRETNRKIVFNPNTEKRKKSLVIKANK